MQQLRQEYLRIPDHKSAEFWNAGRIAHLRALAASGHATPEWNLRRPGRRALDRLDFSRVPTGAAEPAGADTDTRVTLARGAIELATPLYFGDMSFGSLAGIPNVALARAADATGTLTGTGEGGLHPEVARCQRITVQWASARFGVTPRTLRLGQAVVIKVGQGAKPGVGGHLPAAKVTDVIRRTRRIPENRDAISPAPHHDIYSIEDLGQRIAALKHITNGKPVFVKVAATNYAPYIASGVARMGGDGIILDGAGAGTGASPTVMKDHTGLPIEYATAGVDRMLRKERLRDGFSIVSAGTVSSAMDAARLMALGADCVSIGTASLVAMGCVMVHKCHVGSCPALLTTPAQDEPERALDLDWITQLQVKLVHGWHAELQAVLGALDLQSARDLVGRRDLLIARGPFDPEAARLFGVKAPALPRVAYRPHNPAPAVALAGTTPDVFPQRIATWISELAGTRGAHAGEAQIASMGSTAAPFAEEATRITDHLRLDGAQVTRPAIDSYRERVDIHLRLSSGLRLSAPLVLSTTDATSRWSPVLVRAANALGLLSRPAEGRGHADVPGARVLGSGVRILHVPSRHDPAGLPRDRRRYDAILIDEDHADSDAPIERALVAADRALPPEAPDLLASASTLRGAGDAAKLVALGATAVAMPGVVAQALAGADDEAMARAAVEELAFGLMREIRLLVGAAGCTAMPSLVGNRELLRAIDLDADTRTAIDVKPAGWG